MEADKDSIRVGDIKIVTQVSLLEWPVRDPQVGEPLGPLLQIGAVVDSEPKNGEAAQRRRPTWILMKSYHESLRMPEDYSYQTSLLLKIKNRFEPECGHIPVPAHPRIGNGNANIMKPGAQRRRVLAVVRSRRIRWHTHRDST
jgi:hypothetical protein